MTGVRRTREAAGQAHFTCAYLAPQTDALRARARAQGLRFVSLAGAKGLIGLQGSPWRADGPVQVFLGGQAKPRHGAALPRRLIDFDCAALLSGNGVALAVDLRTGAIAAQNTPLSLPQLYYAESRQAFVVSTFLPAVIRLTRDSTLSPDAWPNFVLLQSLPDGDSWFKNIHRLPSGCQLHWAPGRGIRQRRITSEFDPKQRLGRASTVFSRLRQSVAATLQDTPARCTSCFTYLSGGRDSGLLHHLAEGCFGTQIDSYTAVIHDHVSHEEQKAAEEAAALLRGSHHLVWVTGRQLARLVDAAALGLGQPPLHWYPLLWRLAELAYSQGRTIGLDAGGANSLLGLPATGTYDLLEEVRRRGLSPNLLTVLHLYKASVEIDTVLCGPPDLPAAQWLGWYRSQLRGFKTPGPLEHPLRTFCVEHLSEARRYFGATAVADVLGRREALAAALFPGRTLSERLHILYLSGHAHHYASQCYEIGAANGVRVVKPFFDVEVVKACLAIPPEKRLRRGRICKPLIDDFILKCGLAALSRPNVGNTWHTERFEEVLKRWMRSGPLSGACEDICRPPFLPASEFRRMRTQPDRFFFKLLVFDRFLKATGRLARED